MEQTRKSHTFFLMALIAAIVLVTYNITLFVICGFDGHGGSFWISFAFAHVAFVAFAVSGLLIQISAKQSSNWLLGYSILRYSMLYSAAELALSITFIALDYAGLPWAVALIIQLLLLAAYCVLVLMSFMKKSIVRDMEAHLSQQVAYIKFLRVEIDAIAEHATGSKVKAAYFKLSEQFHLSDPMVTAELNELDAQIISGVVIAKGLSDTEDLLEQARYISKLLNERNKMCRMLK